MVFLGYSPHYDTQIYITALGTALITAGAILIAFPLFRLLGGKLASVRKKATFKWAAVFSLVPIFLEGMIHFGLSGFPYPGFVFIGAGVPMFNPAVSMYFSSIHVGVYLYPLQILQTATSSLMAGAIISYIMENRLYKKSGSLAFGSFAVCPFCAISSIPYGLVVTSIASTTLSFTFLNFFDSVPGLIVTSLLGQGGLLYSLSYVSKQVKRVKLEMNIPASAVLDG